MKSSELVDHLAGLGVRVGDDLLGLEAGLAHVSVLSTMRAASARTWSMSCCAFCTSPAISSSRRAGPSELRNLVGKLAQGLPNRPMTSSRETSAEFTKASAFAFETSSSVAQISLDVTPGRVAPSRLRSRPPS